MKRNKPLTRKTPLKAKKPMRKVSKKQQAINREYAVLRKEFLASHPVCQVCGREPATQIHHRMGRGKYTNDVDWFLAVDFQCHERIESNKNWAREMGYILYK